MKVGLPLWNYDVVKFFTRRLLYAMTGEVVVQMFCVGFSLAWMTPSISLDVYTLVLHNSGAVSFLFKFKQFL